jgi:hypothetical protein
MGRRQTSLRSKARSRRYDASKLELVSAIAVTMPWLPAVAADFDPTQGATMSIDLSAVDNVMQIYERGIVYFDPNHKFDNPPGIGRVNKAHESKQAAPKYYRAK